MITYFVLLQAEREIVSASLLQIRYNICWEHVAALKRWKCYCYLSCALMQLKSSIIVWKCWCCSCI